MQQRQADFNPKALKGLQAFNRQAFYDAHEHFEDAWRESPLDERELYRALLQISGGFYRLTQNKPSAAHKFFDRATFWLQPYPSPYKGINTDKLRSWLVDLLSALEGNTTSSEIITHYYNPIKLPNQEVL